MNCVNCGNPLIDGARFCTACGAKNEMNSTVAAPPQWTDPAVAVAPTPVVPPVAVTPEPVPEPAPVPVAEPVPVPAPVPVAEPVPAPAPVPTTTQPLYQRPQATAPSAYQTLPPYQASVAPQTTAPIAPPPAPAAAPAPAKVQLPRPAYQLQTTRGLGKLIGFSLITFGIYGITQWNSYADDINIAASRYDGRKTLSYFAMLFCTIITLGVFPFVWHHNLSGRIGNELERRGIDYKVGPHHFWLWGVLGSLILVGPFI